MDLFSVILTYFLISYIIRHFKKQIDEKKYVPEWGSKVHRYYIFPGQKYVEKLFVRFLVQVKIAKSPFEIN